MFRIESFLCSILIKAINITTNIYLYTFPTPQSNFKASAKLTLIKGILQHQKLKSWGGGQLDNESSLKPHIPPLVILQSS